MVGNNLQQLEVGEEKSRNEIIEWMIIYLFISISQTHKLKTNTLKKKSCLEKTYPIFCIY